MKKIQILGPGCPKCRKLAQLTGQAASELGLQCEIEKVTSLAEITRFGVMLTPALVVDGEVKVTGKVPALSQIKAMLE